MKTLIFLFIFCFLISATTFEFIPVSHLVTILIMLFLGLYYLIFKRGIIFFDKRFILFSLFLLIINISLIWSVNLKNSILFNLLFLEGVFIYLLANNFKYHLKKKVHLFILVPFFIYIFAFITSESTSINLYPYVYQFLPQHGVGKTHLHIGDLAALFVLVSLYYLLLNKKKAFRVVFLVGIFVGFYIMLISLSRTSTIMVIAGSYFLFKGLSTSLYANRFFKYFFIIAVVFVLFYISLDKSLLLSRPYFLQSLKGFFDYPLGVGLGNFEFISKAYLTKETGYREFSTNTHNIFLEILSGVGVFSLLFFIWFYKVFSLAIFQNKSKEALLPRALFLALTINFLFDITYTIPGMTWLWFLFLGLLV